LQQITVSSGECGLKPMDELQSLSHTKWDCKTHIVLIPKCRRKSLYRELRRHLGEVFRSLAAKKGCGVEEGT